MTEYHSLCWIKNTTACSGNKYSIAGCWAGVLRPRPGEAWTAKWKIPAEDVFLFPVGRKRVLLEAASSLANTESTMMMTERPT